MSGHDPLIRAAQAFPAGLAQPTSLSLKLHATMDNPPETDTEGGANPQRTRNPIPHFLFISFMLFLLTNHNGDEFLARHQYQDALRTLTHQARLFARYCIDFDSCTQLSNYTAWMNGTKSDSNFTVVRV